MQLLQNRTHRIQLLETGHSIKTELLETEPAEYNYQKEDTLAKQNNQKHNTQNIIFRNRTRRIQLLETGHLGRI